MQSTLDRKVIYLMLRAARRQETERRAERRRVPEPGALPASLTADAWWLNAPNAAHTPRAIAGPRLVTETDSNNFPAKVTADE
jgi:hypothetical protein